MLKFSSWRRLFALAFIVHLSTGCNDKPIGARSDIVARVGERAITAREFQLNYEFGFSSLKIMPDRKRSYLESMIDELLLSMEGYRLGLDKTDRVQNLEAGLFQELLVEELLRAQVTETITVSDEEIRDAITRSKVRWKFRYWAEADLTAANHIYELMQEQGYANVVAERLDQEELRSNPKDFETDYLTWFETPPELLDAIRDLQIGEVSRPIELNQIYFLIQMIDIRREALADYDYESTFNRFKQILFQRKLKNETTSYVAEFMTAKDVVVKGEAFQTLAEALLEWQRQIDNTRTPSEAIEEAGETEPALQKLHQQSRETLITFAGGRWSLKDFIERVNPARLKIKPAVQQRYRAHLKREIALTVRNDLMAKEAISEGLHKSAVVRDQMRAWRDKWVYQEMRQHYLNQNGPNPTLTELADPARPVDHIKQTELILERKLGLLRRMNTVRIYKSVLDTISVTDFKKSRWANLFLFKNSSKRSAVPTVDPALGY